LDGLSELLGDAAHRLEIGFRLTDLSDQDLHDDPVPVSLHDQLCVADPLAHLAELASEREALCDRVGGHDRGGAAVERVRERGRISGPPSELDRFAAQLVAAIPCRFVAKRSRQAGEKPGAELDVVVGEHGETLLEQRY
jgi:hypothetical protein